MGGCEARPSHGHALLNNLRVGIEPPLPRGAQQRLGAARAKQEGCSMHAQHAMRALWRGSQRALAPERGLPAWSSRVAADEGGTGEGVWLGARAKVPKNERARCPL